MGVLLNAFSAVHIWLYRSSGGRLAARAGSIDFTLVTTTGRKTGAQRTVVVLSFEDAGDRLVVASASGAPKDPAWFLNLRANSRVTVQLGPNIYPANAVIAEATERAVLWKKILGRFPKYEDHERRAGRTIPVVRLVRVE